MSFLILIQFLRERNEEQEEVALDNYYQVQKTGPHVKLQTNLLLNTLATRIYSITS